MSAVPVATVTLSPSTITFYANPTQRPAGENEALFYSCATNPWKTLGLNADETYFDSQAQNRQLGDFVYDPAAHNIVVKYTPAPGTDGAAPIVQTTTVAVNPTPGATSSAATASVTSAVQSTQSSIPSSSSGPSQNSSPTSSGVGTASTLPAKPSNSSAPKGTSKLAPGAAAGLAIGCLIAGALVAGFLVWFFLGRARRRRDGKDGGASAIALMNNEKGAGAKVRSLDSGSPISQIGEAGLPQPLEDKAISGEISKISNLIKNHVQSFYHTGRSAGLLDLDDLQALGSDLPLSTGTLSTLLGNADTREIALRFCIAWVIITRMQLKSSPVKSLLPPEVAESFRSMAFGDRGSRAQTGFLAKWRMLTAELMQTAYVRNAFNHSDRRTPALEAALEDLEGILVPFIDSRMDTKQRRQNLEELIKRAAKFAFTLFSQPSTWDYDWQDHQDVASGSLCIFPALIQITDETGEAIKPPRAFSEAVVRRLDG